MKNLLKAITVIMFIAQCGSMSYSQIESFGVMNKPKTPYNDDFPRMILSVFPSRIFNPLHTGIELGLEIRNSSLLSTEIRGTQLFTKRLRDINSSWNPKIQGNVLYVEERIYVKNSAPNGVYFAFGIGHMWSKYNQEWGYDRNINDNISMHYDDTISIRKNYTDVVIKFGYQGISNRFVIGFDVGIGARYKDVRHYDKLFMDGRIDEPGGINVNYISDRETYEWIPIVPISFHLGFVL